MDDGGDGVEEGELALAGEPADRFGERRRGQGAGGDDDIVPVGGRQAGDLAALERDQRMGARRFSSTAAAKPSRSTASAPPAGTLCASAQAMISDRSARISRCSTPTALVAASSERKELEQTSSARRLGLVGGGRASAGAFRAARPARRPRPTCQAASRPGEPAADDMNGTHGRVPWPSPADASTGSGRENRAKVKNRP